MVKLELMNRNKNKRVNVPDALAYTVPLAARKINISRVSMWREVKRGLVRTCGGFKRKPLIAHLELERYLRDTEKVPA